MIFFKREAENIKNNSEKQLYLKYCIAGALGGIANGLFGAGGGLFLVPLFMHWIKLEEKHAFATSVAVILPLSIVSAVLYFMQGSLDFSVAVPYLLGGLAGGFLSGKLFQKIPISVLRRVFGLLILYGGIRAILNL